MSISRTVKRMLLVIPASLLLSVVSWGQSWDPAVRVDAGIAPARLVRVDGRWDRDREWHGRDWREHEWRGRARREREWRERERREREWRRWHRREEWREHYRY